MNTNIEQFFQSAAQNSQLQEILEANNTPSGIVNIANQYGYKFSEEELKSVLNQIQLSNVDEAELDTESLYSVAGGMGPREPKRTPWKGCTK